nr:hypothetical protein OG296_36015 [Streptomyces sp. NBC_01001]
MHTVHILDEGGDGQPRPGLFFRARAWSGTPEVREPDKCLEWARAAMVARLADEGALHPGPVREALLAFPREVLMPQGYLRRTEVDVTRSRWTLPDWTRPADREELLEICTAVRVS